MRLAKTDNGMRCRGATFALWGVLAFALAACTGAATESGDVVAAASVTNEQPRQGLPIGAVEQNRFDESGDAAVNRQSRALPAPEVFPATGPLIGQPEQPRRRVVLLDNGTVSLNFANVDIREVIAVVLGDTLKLNYVIDPRIQGTVTARTARPIARSDVIPAMENILALNGVALTHVGGVFRVVPLNEAAAGISSLVVSPSPGDLAQGFGTHILPLRFASARSMESCSERPRNSAWAAKSTFHSPCSMEARRIRCARVSSDSPGACQALRSAARPGFPASPALSR